MLKITFTILLILIFIQMVGAQNNQLTEQDSTQALNSEELERIRNRLDSIRTVDQSMLFPKNFLKNEKYVLKHEQYYNLLYKGYSSSFLDHRNMYRRTIIIQPKFDMFYDKTKAYSKIMGYHPEAGRKNGRKIKVD